MKRRLAEILFLYGELRNARAIAKTIVEAREEEEIDTSFQLRKCCKSICRKQKNIRY